MREGSPVCVSSLVFHRTWWREAHTSGQVHSSTNSFPECKAPTGTAPKDQVEHGEGKLGILGYTCDLSTQEARGGGGDMMKNSKFKAGLGYLVRRTGQPKTNFFSPRPPPNSFRFFPPGAPLPILIPFSVLFLSSWSITDITPSSQTATHPFILVFCYFISSTHVLYSPVAAGQFSHPRTWTYQDCPATQVRNQDSTTASIFPDEPAAHRPEISSPLSQES